MDDFYCDGAVSQWDEFLRRQKNGNTMEKPILTEKSIYDAKSLEALLLRICDKLEDEQGLVPEFLEEFWNTRRSAFYENIEKSKRRAQYLKLKEEFEGENICQVP